MNVLIVNFPISSHIARLHVMKYYLISSGATVQTISSSIWGDTDKRLKLTKKPWLFFFEIVPLIKYWRCIIAEVKTGSYDKIIIGYPAYLDVFVLNIFCRKYRSKFYTDYFLSLFDTVILDRKMYKQHGFMAKLFFYLDRWLLRSSKTVITDTDTNSKRYCAIFSISNDVFIRFFVGSRLTLEDLPEKLLSKRPASVQVGWVGSFIPLHGIQIILQSALELKNLDVQFHLIGDGQDFDNAKYYIKEHSLENVRLYGKCNFAESMQILRQCDACLGIFGGSDKSKSVIPFKVFDYLYLGKFIITQSSPAFNEINALGQIKLIEADASAIAKSIVEYKDGQTASFNLDSEMLHETKRFMQHYPI